MKYLYFAVLALCLFLAVQVSVAQERNFGLGIMIGEPTGLSAKLWTTNENAFDFGLGSTTWGNRNYSGNRTHFHMDYLWHSFGAFHTADRFPLYYGIGGRINSGGGYTNSLAVRGVFGIAWMPHRTPIDLFFELAPSIELTSPTGFVLDGAIGARYYF